MRLMHHPSATDLDQARRCLLEQGVVPSGLVDDTLVRSWQRSHHAGLSPLTGLSEPPICSGSELKEALGAQHDFLAQARPVMEFVFDQMRDSGSLVVLADTRGLLLHSMGDTDFVSRADRVSLRPGALWNETDRGTNAIGTALAEGSPVVIHGAEHYLDHNSFLTCAAAPVRSPNGRIKGVLDISGDRRGHHPHTFALVRSAARMIEDRLFHARHHHDLVMRLHPHIEGLGGVGEGLLALSADGWVVGANSQARQWLSLDENLIGACTLEHVTGTGLGLCPPGRILSLRTASKLPLYARLDGRPRDVVNLKAPAAKPVDAQIARPNKVATNNAVATTPLEAPALDPRVHDALTRAQRVQARGIAVLIQGESGTGKEVFARTLHTEGTRAHKPFVAVNCAALPETLIEAELFGYVGGAFTGARREGSPGRIREAEGGTLFLDEIGDMPLGLQARLLRVLQDKVVMPLGGSKPVPVDFVLVCATHRKLKDAIAAGQFREDLYYRLNGLTLTLPALRERQDFPRILHSMLDQICQDMNRPLVSAVHPGLMQALSRYPWPGNLRQMHGMLRTACALLDADEPSLDWPHLPEDMVAELRKASPAEPAHASAQNMVLSTSEREQPATPANLRQLSQQTMKQVIEATGGNMSEAARQLGISRNTLYRRLKDQLS